MSAQGVGDGPGDDSSSFSDGDGADGDGDGADVEHVSTLQYMPVPASSFVTERISATAMVYVAAPVNRPSGAPISMSCVASKSSGVFLEP